MPSAHVAAPRLMSVEEAKRLVLAQVAPPRSEQVGLGEGIGRVLAQDLIARVSLPPFDNSAMDGYAIRASETAGASEARPIILRLVGEVAAGHVLERPVGRGEAATIMTGAPLPPGADSVVALEEARLRGEQVEIRAAIQRGRHVRKAGEDITADAVALATGARIQLQHVGLLASLGYAEVAVYRQPSVAVLATGSELVEINEPLAPGKIRNANSPTLLTLLRRAGFHASPLGIVADDRALIRRRLDEAVQHDVVLISGGVSVGAHDLVKAVLRDMGMETLFWRVNMKPGKPLLFGRLGKSMVFGLPGNPISCVVCFLEFIAPYLRAASGEAEPPAVMHAKLTQPLAKQESRTLLLTAQLREEAGTLLVTPTPQQGSGMLNSLAHANAFIRVPAERMQLQKGSLVEVLPLGDDPWRR